MCLALSEWLPEKERFYWKIDTHTKKLIDIDKQKKRYVEDAMCVTMCGVMHIYIYGF